MMMCRRAWVMVLLLGFWGAGNSVWGGTHSYGDQSSAYVVALPSPGITVAGSSSWSSVGDPIPRFATYCSMGLTIDVDPFVRYDAGESLDLDPDHHVIQKPGRLDEDHAIVEAQRNWRMRYTGKSARVIRRSTAKVPRYRMTLPGVLLLRPDLLLDQPQWDRRIPAVPAPQKRQKVPRFVHAD